MLGVRILSTSIHSEPSFDLTSVLFGYAIGQLEIHLHERLVIDLQKQFNSLRESFKVYRRIEEEDMLMLAYDLVEEARKINKGEKKYQLQQLPGLLAHNLG
jgi:hypothetical protein